MPATDWRDVKYDEVFTDTLAGLERRRHHDAAFVVSDAEGVLRDLYVQDGNDWGGRGEVQDIVLGATIAAYESFIAAWKASSPSQEELLCP